MERIAWLFSLVTALWFGVMARRAHRNWLLWGVAGGVFALANSTIVFGLSEAAFIPLSEDANVHFRKVTTSTAAGIVGSLGWLFTLSLQRWHLGHWKE